MDALPNDGGHFELTFLNGEDVLCNNHAMNLPQNLYTNSVAKTAPCSVFAFHIQKTVACVQTLHQTTCFIPPAIGLQQLGPSKHQHGLNMTGSQKYKNPPELLGSISISLSFCHLSSFQQNAQAPIPILLGLISHLITGDSPRT